MGLYKVTPTHSVRGYNAPSLYEEGSKESEVISAGKKRSGLGRFEIWEFTAEHVKTSNTGKRGYRNG